MASSENGLRVGLDLRLAQRLVITPRLQQAIKLLQLTRLELTQEVRQEMLENPLLDEMTDDTGAADADTVDAEGPLPQASGDGDGESLNAPDEGDFAWQEEAEWDFDSGEETPTFEAQPSYDQFMAAPVSHTEHLLWQLRLASMTEIERRVGEALIGNINEDGYLACPLAEVCETLQVPPALAESVLRIVQEFDPPGVGARNLKECLLIQVAQLHCDGSLIEEIVVKHLEHMQAGEYRQIARACHATLSEVQQACAIISRLEPKPCRPFCVTDNPVVTPDVTVVPWEGKYLAILIEEGLPKLRINAFYRNLMRAEGCQKSTRAYLKERFRSALWLVRSIEQRNQTIQRVAQSIVNFQSAFLEKGMGHLKPLVLKQIADDTAVHESTVSRVTTRKYMDTPQGIYEMKFFFNGGIPRAGETGEPQCSSTVVREMIRSMVAGEDASHPLRDQDIAERLRKEKIEISRRTISKYRVLLKIPSVHMRKVALR